VIKCVCSVMIFGLVTSRCSYCGTPTAPHPQIIYTMGQILSEPIVDKHTTEGADVRLGYGASSMQGWRIGMAAR
jgi:hypothetical protein